MNNNLTLLYVEDDAVVRENFTAILQRYFNRVVVTDNGRDALELYVSEQPDVALLDIAIPHTNGLQVAATIRESNEEIPIIMLTAHADQQKLLRAVNLQLFAYLVKPILQPQLDTTLRRVIKRLIDSSTLMLGDGYRWNGIEQQLEYNGSGVKISNNERLILALLCRHPNRYYTATHIADQIFDIDSNRDPSGNNVVQIISRFKRKLEKSYNPDAFFIQNTYGAGYRIVLPKSQIWTKTSAT